MQAYFWIAVGSALGGMARFWCTGVGGAPVRRDVSRGARCSSTSLGSFIIGFFVTLTGPRAATIVDPNIRACS